MIESVNACTGMKMNVQVCLRDGARQRLREERKGKKKQSRRERQVRRNCVDKLSPCGDLISLKKGTFPMAGLSGLAVNSVRTSEQKAMSDEEGLRELNPFKSPK